jgi:hypothetical protein
MGQFKQPHIKLFGGVILKNLFKNKGLKGLTRTHLKKVKLRNCGSILEIEYSMKKTDTMDDHVKRSLFDIKNTLKIIHDSPELEKYETIKFSGMTLIKYSNGRVRRECGLELMFDLAKLESVDYAYLTIERLLALQDPYRISVSGAIRKELTEYAMNMLYPER